MVGIHVPQSLGRWHNIWLSIILTDFTKMVRLLQDLEELVKRFARPIRFDRLEQYALVLVEFHATYSPEVMHYLYFHQL